jgi:hypothetical protein
VLRIQLLYEYTISNDERKFCVCNISFLLFTSTNRTLHIHIYSSRILLLQKLSNCLLLDIARAFVNAADQAVPVELFNRKFSCVADTTEPLDGTSADVCGDLGGFEFCLVLLGFGFWRIEELRTMAASIIKSSPASFFRAAL